jgi:hypothetical protein
MGSCSMRAWKPTDVLISGSTLLRQRISASVITAAN